MIKYLTSLQKFSLLFLMLIFAGITLNAQQGKRVQPVWWFGESVAANFNYYRGLTQMLNNNLTVPTAFNKGQGIRPYASLLTEYRPNKVLGGMLNIAYDNRGGKFDGVLAPCNCAANLSTNVSYISLEPSIRIAPFASAFYLFAGPTISFNITKDFTYTQDKQNDTRGELGNIKKTILSAQAGAGIDFPISKRTSATQMTLSPFASFQTNYGHNARDVESWSVYTVRTGVALKFGMGRTVAIINTPKVADGIAPVVPEKDKDVQFSVRAPKVIPLSLQVKETFPLRNSVFFDMGSSEIPSRYILLNKSQAASFQESQLQESQPDNLNNGRSARQLAVYHNILNIMGDRLKSNPESAITLQGSSDKNPVQGKLLAENVKNYLVNVFGINSSRISTEGRDKPMIASEQSGGTRDLALLREGDRRVDIISRSPKLLMEVGGDNPGLLKPVQINAVQVDPMDSHVIFNTDGAAESLKSWSVDLSDENGTVQHFGPYTTDQASVSGKTILGNSSQGNYKIVMTGETKSGQIIKKESSVSLMKMNDAKQQGLRYSILFDFDRSTTIASYEKFLTEVVAPLVPENGTVIIHGHTDITGDENYNMKLSQQRSKGAEQILQKALSNSGKKGIKYEVYSFGKDPNASPFENKLPEERFYNRTVIIDILSNQ